MDPNSPQWRLRHRIGLVKRELDRLFRAARCLTLPEEFAAVQGFAERVKDAVRVQVEALADAVLAAGKDGRDG